MEEQAPEAYRLGVEEVLSALGTDLERGLSESEARARLRRYGRNVLAVEKTRSAWRRLAAQFQDVLVVLLLIASAISTGMWLYERQSALPYEAIAIVAIVLVNAMLGFVQEARAEAAVAALRAMAADDAAVLRDGERRQVSAAELVPGDLVLIEEGDVIAADARVVQSTALQASEASLTGESLPVLKNIDSIGEEVPLGDRHNMVFSGTTITYGRGRAVVTATGMETEMGHIATLLENEADETTPLQHELNRVGRILGGVVIFIALAMITTIFALKDVRGWAAAFDVLLLGVALAVAAVPEGLPAVVTAVLSLGVRRMAERRAIVRRLAAVETLGSASVIASDKTGTLTKNEMTVRTIVTASGRVNLSGAGYSPKGSVTQVGTEEMSSAVRVELERALVVADCVNNATLHALDGTWVVQGDPTEGALLVAARKAGLDVERLEERYTRVGEVPFSSERKMMSTLHQDIERDGCLLVFSKGAPDMLLARCEKEFAAGVTHPLTDERRGEILAVNDALGGEALRTLGVAFRPLDREVRDPAVLDDRVEKELVFTGLIGMIDPARPEAKEAVARAIEAGIRPLMITGDHPTTASVIATELGILGRGRVVTGLELKDLTDEGLAESIEDVSVFARVNPEDKLRIVQALQHDGAIVAMTGDGVNDAPALKAADIGVAMGITGTDVSKAAADVIVADDNFATIVVAVEEGRAIFANIRKFLRYLLSSNIGEVLTMFLGILLAGFIGLPTADGAIVLPLLATHILWINLVTDGAPAMALGVDPGREGVMRQMPRRRDESVITGRMWFGIFFVGIVMAIGTLVVLDACLPGGLIKGFGGIQYAQTMAFTTLTLFQLFNVFNARSDERSAFGELFANRLLWGAVLLSLGLHACVIYVPFLQHAFSTTSLSGLDWLRCAVAASSVLWLRELSKVVMRWWDGRTEAAAWRAIC